MSQEQHGYTQEHVGELEGVFEDGYLSGGGFAALEWMLRDVQLEDADVLDVGSGLGGGAVDLAARYPLRSIVGVDIEPYLVTQAVARTKRYEVLSRASFIQCDPGGLLSFNSGSFDVVYSKESIVHVREKKTTFSEIRRVLRPAGSAVIMDWIGNGLAPSADFSRYLSLDGLHFHLSTFEEYATLLMECGLHVVGIDDCTSRALAETRACVAAVERQQHVLRGRLGESRWSTYVESWRLQEQLLAEGTEVRVVRFRADRR